MSLGFGLLKSPFPEAKGHTIPLREIENMDGGKFTELKMALQFSDVEEANSALSSPISFAQPDAVTGTPVSSLLMANSQATPKATPSSLADHAHYPISDVEVALGSNLKPTHVLALDQGGHFGRENRPAEINASTTGM